MVSYLEEVWGRGSPRHYTPRIFIGVRMTNSNDEAYKRSAMSATTLRHPYWSSLRPEDGIGM
jgi:hypothetical protein